jgi:alpha-glucosidase
VGEIVLKDITRTARYTRPDELHSAFNFPFLRAGWDAGALREVITTTIQAFSAVGAISTWVLGNHDVTRVVTRYGGDDVALGVRRSMAGHLLMLGLPGGAYIYQGDELGLPEILDIDPQARQDPIFTRSDGAVVGRDGCRIPLPWTEHGATFGFSPDAGSAEPWLPLPDGWGSFSVAAQEQDPTAALTLIRRALAVRASHPGFADGSFAWSPSGPQVLHFTRASGVGVVANLGPEPVAMPKYAQILVTSQPIVDGMLPPDAACWYTAA